MSASLKNLFIFSIILFSTACNDEIINNYYQQEGGTAPDVNVISSSYSLATVHSSHIDTTTSEYNYILNLKIKLDKPENRNQINKIIIVNESGYGWEFFSNKLESFFSDSLGGYELKNLVFHFYSSNPSYQSTLYKVRLFSKTNKAAEDYMLFIIPDFMYPYNFYHNWYTHDIYQIQTEYYSSINSVSGEVVWLNQFKQFVGNSEFNSLSFNINNSLKFNNVPNDAYYFYLTLNREKNDIVSSLKTSVYQIEDRYPDNVQILSENIYSMDVINYIPQIQKILILDRNYRNLYVIDFITLSLENKIAFSNTPHSMTYSSYDNKIYVGSNNGRLYSFGLNETSPNFIKNLGTGYINSLVAINNYLVAGCSDYNFRILNINNNSVTVENNSYAYNCRNLIFNNTNNVVYGFTGYEILRFKFDITAGSISAFKSTYSGSSDYYDLLLYPDNSKIISSGGRIYNCSPDMQNDLTNFANLQYNFVNASFSNDNSIVILRRGYYSYDPRELLILNKDNFEITGQREDFWGDPRYVIVEGDLIKVISKYNSRIMGELYSYSDIISGGGILPKKIKDQYYLSKKI